MKISRRNLLQTAAILLVDQWASSHFRALALARASSDGWENTGRKVIVVACGGIRRAETFHDTGVRNIPHLYRELLPRSVFYPSFAMRA